MKKLLFTGLFMLPFTSTVMAQSSPETQVPQGALKEVPQQYLVDYDGQDDKEKKAIRYDSITRKYIEGSADLDYYRPRNITGASKILARDARRNHWTGEYIYNPSEGNPNEIRPADDPVFNSCENEDNKLCIKKKRNWLYYEVPLQGEYFQYRLSPKLRLQEAYNRNLLARDRHQKSLLQAKRIPALPKTERNYRENPNYISYKGDYNRLDGEKSGEAKLWDLYFAHM